LELLLVLTLLLVAAAISWPTVVGLYQRHQLQTAAEQVRVQLSGARVRAIQSGAVYQFRFEPGGQRFLVVPFDVAAPSGDIDSSTDNGGSFSGTLPEGMRFQASEAYPITVAQMGAEWLAALPDAQQLQSVGWSSPFLFSPDGSAATDSTFDVVDENERFVSLSVRGLTAAVAVGPVLQRREEP